MEQQQSNLMKSYYFIIAVITAVIDT